MHFIIDNLVAILVTATIMLILVVLRLQDQDVMVESVNSYALRNQQLSFVEMIEKDVQGAYEINSIVDSTGNGVNTGYSFHSKIVDEGSNTILDRRITYKRVPSEVRDGKQLYQIERWVGNPTPGTGGIKSGDKVEGRSLPTLSRWVIESRSRDNLKVSDSFSTRRVYVLFDAMPIKYAKTRIDNVLDKNHYESTFIPVVIQSGGVPPEL